MARLDEGLDPEEHPSEALELLPPGIYVAQVTESDIVPTKAGDGKILKVTLQITEGDYEGRLIWDRFNIKNPNPTAQSIALKQLSKLAKACGIPFLEDSEELHFKPIIVRLAVVKDKTGNYSDKNEPKGYEALGDPEAAKEPTVTPATMRATPNEQIQRAQQQAKAGVGGAGGTVRGGTGSNRGAGGAPWRKSA